MIIGSIPGPFATHIKDQIGRCVKQGAMPEWRVDLWESEEVPEGDYFLFTLQRKGRAPEEWLQEMETWSKKVQPLLIDIDLEAAETCFERAQKLFPHAQWIISSHGSKEPFDALVKRGHALQPAIVKVVQEVQNPVEALELLWKVKQWNEQGFSTIGIGQGRGGELTRILAPLASMPYMFASLSPEEAVAPGQLSLQELQEVYGFSKLHHGTALYGLIGNPVDKSVSHRTHNAVLRGIGREAIYVKACLEEGEVASFLEKARFQGLSVTMPFKQFWGEQAINTLVKGENEWKSRNTDGIGACESIERRIALNGKKVYIVGAGGTAYGIAAEALKRGAFVTLYNRSLERAQGIAKSLSCQAKALELLEEDLLHADVLIQTTPVGWGGAPESIVDVKNLPLHAVVLDVLSGSPTLLLKQAAEKGCPVISGAEMFALQAVEQFKTWFPDVEKQQVEEILWEQLILPKRK